ncbi:HelD family protein [Streptomyces sp. NPDC057197]|uniref:HelD family protein n=1 Tax=Streptomyces sp. NPDC057197 TaxID=3346045 RepID=UPI003642E8BE
MTPPDPAPGPVPAAALAAERAHHDTCRAALAAMVEGAGEQVVVSEDVSASGADAEVLGYRLRSRAKALRELPEGPLFFGRLDFGAGHPDHGGQSYHVGRLRLTEAPTAPPLVVDWRAPVSRAFYRASARDPQGVAVRRRFGWAPGSRGDSADLTGLEDEHLGRGESRTSDIVAREIERPRIGPMRDIAATIQPEQDDLVRAALDTTVCVQGAPGTGKTAVGLHRAAYLLYTHPRRLTRKGLLILGPNRTFLSYIAEVLPALGESGVRQSTVAEEIARHPLTGRPEVRAEDGGPAARVKHDARMARVLRRALYARVSTEGVGPLVVADGSYRWRVPAGALARIVTDVRAERVPYAIGRERVRTRAVRLLQEQAERRSGPRPASWVRRTERARALSAYVDAVWPAVRPEQVVAALLADPAVLARAADGLLDAGEQRALLWARPPRSYRTARWSAADLVLLDEVAGLIEHPEGYGHIVVDEAQDLSPMECRAIARRAPYASLTVLGDLAQGTTPWAAGTWSELLAHLGRPQAPVVRLTTGFRVPRAVVELSNRLLARLDADVPPARSLRGDGELRLREVAADGTADGPVGGALTAAVVAAVRDALAREGSVGVITADAETGRTLAALAAAGIPAAGPDGPNGPDGPDGPDGGGSPGPGSGPRPPARVTVLPAGLAKGLEYDHVVAVEPAAIAEAEDRGLNRLYVVLTRAVSRLDVVHARPLPF